MHKSVNIDVRKRKRFSIFHVAMVSFFGGPLNTKSVQTAHYRAMNEPTWDQCTNNVSVKTRPFKARYVGIKCTHRTRLLIIGVTRFGEMLPKWQHFKSFWQKNVL